MEDKYILKYIKDTLKEEGFNKILNIGLNNIDSTILLAEYSFDIYVVDKSENKIKKLKDKALSKGFNNVYVYVDNIDSINLKSNYFNGVILLNQFKDIEKLKKYILIAYDVLQSDGILFIEISEKEELSKYLDKFRKVEAINFDTIGATKIIKCIK